MKLKRQRKSPVRAFSKDFKGLRRDRGDEGMVQGELDAHIHCDGNVHIELAEFETISLSLKTFFLACLVWM